MGFAKDQSFFSDQNALSDETSAFVNEDWVMTAAYSETIKASNIISQPVKSREQQRI